MHPYEFGRSVAKFMEKDATGFVGALRTAAGAAGAAAKPAAKVAPTAAGAAGAVAKPAAKVAPTAAGAAGAGVTTGRQLPSPALKLAPGQTPASLERTTGTILHPTTGAPIRMRPAPPPSAPPTGAPARVPDSAMQQLWSDATSGGRARMLGLNPEGRGAAAPPSMGMSWEQLSPAQQAAVRASAGY